MLRLYLRRGVATWLGRWIIPGLNTGASEDDEQPIAHQINGSCNEEDNAPLFHIVLQSESKRINMPSTISLLL